MKENRFKSRHETRLEEQQKYLDQLWQGLFGFYMLRQQSILLE